jgi:hypothetical protein
LIARHKIPDTLYLSKYRSTKLATASAELASASTELATASM